MRLALRWLLPCRRRPPQRVQPDEPTRRPSLVDASDLADGGDADRAFFARLARRRLLLPPIGSPYGVRRRWWLQLLLVLAVVEAVYVPYLVAFQPDLRPIGGSSADEAFLSAPAGEAYVPAWTVVLQWLVDGLFVLEVLLMFRTTLPIGPLEGSAVQQSAHLIACTYARSAVFAVDVCALLPVDLGLWGLGLLELRSAAALALRTNRLLHVSRVFTYHGRSLLMLSRLRRVLAFWALFVLLSHWVACGWWALRYRVGAGSGAGIGFALELGARRGATRVSARSSGAQQYLSAFYWSVTTLLKVPSVAPTTAAERSFTCAVTLVGAIAFAFFNGEVHAIVRVSLGATLARTSHVGALRACLGRAKAGGLTRRTALDWATTASREEKLQSDVAKEQTLLRSLPRALRIELAAATRAALSTSDCGLASRVSPAALAELAIAAWPAVFVPRQVLVAADAMSAELFILQRGSLRLSGGVAAGAGSHAGFKKQRERACEAPNARRASGGSSAATTVAMGGRASSGAIKRASALSLPVSLPGAETSRFRVLERPGALTGTVDMCPAPFIVESLKLSHVYVLSGPLLLRRLEPADASAVRVAVAQQQRKHVEYLASTRRPGEHTERLSRWEERLSSRLSAADAAEALDGQRGAANGADANGSAGGGVATSGAAASADADADAAAPAAQGEGEAAMVLAATQLHGALARMQTLANDASAALAEAAGRLREARDQTRRDEARADAIAFAGRIALADAALHEGAVHASSGLAPASSAAGAAQPRPKSPDAAEIADLVEVLDQEMQG